MVFMRRQQRALPSQPCMLAMSGTVPHNTARSLPPACSLTRLCALLRRMGQAPLPSSPRLLLRDQLDQQDPKAVQVSTHRAPLPHQLLRGCNKRGGSSHRANIGAVLPLVAHGVPPGKAGRNQRVSDHRQHP